jgi:hypothetical protein
MRPIAAARGGDEEGEAERGYGDRYRYSQSATK